MVLLSNKEIDTIHDLLVTRGVSHESLRMDLLDHLCCMVEERMDSGAPFEVALSESSDGFGPQGFEKTQEETLYLLTSKFRIMKTFTSICGIFGSVLTLTGILFKIMHWVPGSVLLFLGILVMMFIYLPLLLAVRIHESSGAVAQFINVTGVLSAMVFLIAVVFKIMHWPYSNMLLTGSAVAIAFIFIPGYFIRSYRMAENKLMSIAYVLAMFTGVFLLYRMATNGESGEMRKSIYVMHASLRNEVQQVSSERQQLVASMEDGMSTEMKALNGATEELLNYIENMRVESMALTQEVGQKEAADMNLKDATWGLNTVELSHMLMNDSSEANADQLRELMLEWKAKARQAGISEARLQSWLVLDDMETPDYGTMTWKEAHFANATIFSLVTYLEQLSLEVNQRFIQVAVSQKSPAMEVATLTAG